MKKIILAILCSGLWITFSEFIRNEFLLKAFWSKHYTSLGLTFQTNPINGVMWMIWSFIFAYILFRLLTRFSFYEVTWLGWIFTFVLMWITLYNLQVLPIKILIGAIPLSLLEILVAEMIIRKLC